VAAAVHRLHCRQAMTPTAQPYRSPHAIVGVGSDMDHRQPAFWPAPVANRSRWGLGCVGLFGAGRHGEQLARLGDVGGAVVVGEQPVVADAMEAPGQHVHQEPADELVRRERHRLPAARTFDAIVPPAERHATIISGDETAVRDGDAMGDRASTVISLRSTRSAPPRNK
jgi:hypothetical protein